jgi:peptidoglycan-associated lipoprotein
MKRALILLTILMIALLAVGCGKKAQVESPTPPRDNQTTGGNDNGTGKGTDGGDVGGEKIDALKLVTIYYDFDKSNIRDDQKSGLRSNYEFLKTNGAVRILIEGHCDERGTVEYNLALGERRARAAMDYLASLGISRDRMSIISYGKEHAAVLGSDESAWSRNRRAEFVQK